MIFSVTYYYTVYMLCGKDVLCSLSEVLLFCCDLLKTIISDYVCANFFPQSSNPSRNASHSNGAFAAYPALPDPRFKTPST